MRPAIAALLLTACAPAPIMDYDAPYQSKYAAPEPRPARLPPPTCEGGFEPKCDERQKPEREVECSQLWFDLPAGTRIANGKPEKECA
jgi:hypothetical protein